MDRTKKYHSEKIRGIPLIYQGHDLVSGNGSIFQNIRDYFLRRAPKQTLVAFRNQGERDEFAQRILQRLNITVSDYSVLNIHKIGLNVPGRYVFEELLKWDGTSLFWPNRIAKVERVADQIEHIQIFLFGLQKMVSLYGDRWPLVKFIRLFTIDALRIQPMPDKMDRDNARFLLYKCSGGYPIGIFSIYVRSSINDLHEIEQTQLFLMVAFNFYGRKKWFYTKIINRFWEAIHNRVSANILNRIKYIYERQFNSIIEGLEDTEAK